MKTKFRLLEMCYWAQVGAFTTYVVSILNARGVGSADIGLMLALGTAGACVGQIVLSWLSDFFQSSRRFFLFGVAALLALSYAIFFTASFPVVCVLYTLMIFIRDPLNAILDTWVIKSQGGRAYGSIRSMGSVAYAFVTLIVGLSVSAFGYFVTVAVATIAAIGNIYLALRIPDAPRVVAKGKSVFNPALLLKRVTPALILFLIGMFLYGASVMPIYGMIAVIVSSLGGGATHQGIALFFNAFIEFPFMRTSGRIARLSPQKRLIFSMCLYVVSSCGMAFSRSPWLATLFFGMSGAAFGLHLPARREIILKFAPPQLQTTMHALTDMISGGLGASMGNWLSGQIMSGAGNKTMLLVLCGMQTLGMLFFLIMSKMKGNDEAGSRGNDEAGGRFQGEAPPVPPEA